MTSPKFNSERQARRYEQEVFDGLPPAIRAALNACEESPPRSSAVLAALLRGVSEASVLALLTRKKEPKA